MTEMNKNFTEMEDEAGSEEEITEVEENNPIDELSDADRKVYDAFTAAVADEKDDDSIKLEMIKAGAKFSNVTRLFNQFAIIDGLLMSKEEKAEIVSDAIKDNDVTSEEGFAAAAKYIADEGTNVEAKQAEAWIRAACKKDKQEVFTRPRGAPGAARKHIIDDVIELLVANPTTTKEEMTKYIDEHGNKTAKSWERFYQKIREGFNRIAAA